MTESHRRQENTVTLTLDDEKLPERLRELCADHYHQELLETADEIEALASENARLTGILERAVASIKVNQAGEPIKGAVPWTVDWVNDAIHAIARSPSPERWRVERRVIEAALEWRKSDYINAATVTDLEPAFKLVAALDALDALAALPASGQPDQNAT